MPAGQPFTVLCQTARRLSKSGRADLHIHTTCSDGTYTPAEVVSLARRSGLSAIAITDHDTVDGVAPALAAAAGTHLEIIPAVEITAEHDTRELHLLGYFVHLDDLALRAALARLGRHRENRFWDMVDRLQGLGVSIDEQELRTPTGVLGRRHLAEILVRDRRAGSIREAFHRWLGDDGLVAVPKMRLPAAEAIALVRGAGGVASWAHPSYHGLHQNLVGLRELGLQAVEALYPSFKNSRIRQLRAWAGELGLAVTGGSDCHGPDRAIGTCSVTPDELECLRGMRNDNFHA